MLNNNILLSFYREKKKKKSVKQWDPIKNLTTPLNAEAKCKNKMSIS